MAQEAEEAVPATPAPAAQPADGPADEPAVARREFARLLGEFRRTAVLVPFDENESLWTADFHGVRWICAFSDEEALARFAVARGEAGREWTYRTVLGARLLDVMVPMLPGPGGVALDAGSADGMVFPPVAGVVPDEVAVDLAESQADRSVTTGGVRGRERA
ncbi:SseB family protein [Streptomyces sp. NPDC127114]|uniref:SseB family protein n=1 Tax=Streptomyces sp. NPDC127114 TaxID=3345366 RepID=UPI0036288213